MTLAVLHALTHGLRARGVGRVARAALTLTTPTGKRYLLHRIAKWEAMAVRCCSGPTTFITGAKEDDPQNDVTAPHPLSEMHHTDLHTPGTSGNFLLPSQQQRHESDLLQVKIKDSESTVDALKVYRRHREVMEIKHFLGLIGKLAELGSPSTGDRTQTLEEEDFKALCGQLFINCRCMDADELIYLLRQLSLLKVPSTSKLMQGVLQMIKNEINELPLRQLIFLEFLLRKIALTPLSDALLTAIPILVSSALTSSSQMADLSFFDLSRALTICSSRNVEGSGILLQEMYRRGSIQSTKLAMSLVWTLTNLSSSSLQTKLLSREDQLTREVIMKECMETLAQGIHSLTYQQVETTLDKVYNGCDLGDPTCYNERLLHAVASYICHHSFPFERTAHAIRKMANMNYLSYELVQYMVQLIQSQPEDVPESRIMMLPTISAITSTPLPQQDMVAALDVLMTHKSLSLDSEKFFRMPLLGVATELLSVGYYHPPLMDVLTSLDTFSMFMSQYPKNTNNSRRLLEIDQFLGEVLQSPNRVPETLLEPGRKIAASRSPSKSSLKAMLYQILQDPTCLVSGVITEGGLYLDHLLVLDPEGVPMKLRSCDVQPMGNPSITSLDLPSHATRLAIMDLGSSSVFRPTSVLKGPQRLRQKVLEAAGFKVLSLLQSKIYQHRDEEKVLYVKRELSEAGVAFR